MPHELEYIVNGALMMCDQGVSLVPVVSTNSPNVKIKNHRICTIADKAPIKNILSFGACKIQYNGPCVPVTTSTQWRDTGKLKIHGQQVLLF